MLEYYQWELEWKYIELLQTLLSEKVDKKPIDNWKAVWNNWIFTMSCGQFLFLLHNGCPLSKLSKISHHCVWDFGDMVSALVDLGTPWSSFFPFHALFRKNLAK